MKSDNELIAEFDGWTHKPTLKGKGDGLWYRLNHGQAAWKSSAMRYDKSWDWLMPVVEKIEKLFQEQIDQHNKPRKEEREADEQFSKVVCLNITAGLPYTYDRVLEFIKWYNEFSSTEKT